MKELVYPELEGDAERLDVIASMLKTSPWLFDKVKELTQHGPL